MKKLIGSRSGNTLAYVMMVMVVVFIVVSAVTSLAMTNIRQASAQEKGMQAYYVARSGAELAYEALLTTTPSLLKNDSNPSDPNTFEGNIGKVLTENDIDFEVGTADVRVSVTTQGAIGGNKKIRIESVGTLKDKDISRTVTLEFYIKYDQYPEMVWSN